MLVVRSGMQQWKEAASGGSEACEKQILSVIDNMDFGGIEDGKVELSMEQFILGNVVDAIVSQVMILLKEKNLQLLHDIPDQIKTLAVYGDQIKLQCVLSDFLLSVVHHAPSPDGWVEIKVLPGLKLIQDGNELIHLQFRMAHPGQGLPAALVMTCLKEEIHGQHKKESR
ncbi:hypothetical protein HAX54_035000 [Datura stramonium]|uniref:Histidine kinase domain-containing protein n=1 Tax=Datura stramonium TaxID=4076 RepID=A0ABS8SEQ6_DATST|nr:hypothetical protein [Datura stramonium]